MSAVELKFPIIVRNIPLPMAANKAVGPLKLSIHPGNGSRHDAPTIDGRIIAHGKLCSLHSFTTRDSAMAFV